MLIFLVLAMAAASVCDASFAAGYRFAVDDFSDIVF